MRHNFKTSTQKVNQMMMMKINIITPEQKAKQQAEAFLKSLQESLAKSEDPSVSLAVMLNDQCAATLGRFITNDPAMMLMKETVRKLARVNDPVLITGPSGTGKEIIARALHGHRNVRTFHPVNCAGMPEELIESELFGHVAGSFTGSRGDSKGIMRSAEDGTVFLDEIGEAPLQLQAKLLRALQPGHNGKYFIRPVGGTQHYEISCRIVAATKEDLWTKVQSGMFREDLYGRLMAFELVITPLMERRIDILLILKSLGVEDTAEIEEDIWKRRIELFNVRALQAFARRKKVLG